MADGRKLTLVLTDRCVATCPSCPLSCGPEGSHVMDERLARDVVDQAAALRFGRVDLTGGEPLLYPRLARAILAHARERGIPRRGVDTSAFWGSWDGERMDGALGCLRGEVTDARVGFDAFHREFVSEEAFWRAVRYLDGLGARTVIRVADVQGDRGAGAFLSSLGGEAMSRAYQVFPLAPVGRARSLLQDCFVATPDGEADPHGTLAVAWDGSVHPCNRWGFPLVDRCLGNVRDASLAEALGQ